LSLVAALEVFHLNIEPLMFIKPLTFHAGLSTFLHLDHIASIMKAQGSAARVVGLPVCGFFIDHDNDGFAPPWYTYPNFIKVRKRCRCGQRLHFA
jgi:hypothetical protein